VRIVVADTGPGIPAHVLPHLFTSFVTTKPRGKGTGLGLRICRRIIEEMRGNIRAVNRPQGGARFEITLPIPSPRAVDEDEACVSQ
jgi:signal transduction histidine kinase